MKRKLRTLLIGLAMIAGKAVGQIEGLYWRRVQQRKGRHVQ